MMWCMHRTNIYLTEQQEKALDAIAAADGLSRSEVIRRILDNRLRMGSAEGVERALRAAGSLLAETGERIFAEDADLAIR